MVKASEVHAEVSRRLRINLFWMGKKPFIPGKTYYLKLGTAKVPCRLEKINYLVDASRFQTDGYRDHSELRRAPETQTWPRTPRGSLPFASTKKELLR